MRAMIALMSVLSLSLVPACAHTPPAAAAKEPVASAPAAPAKQAEPAPPSERTCANDDGCDAKALCIRNRCVAITSEVELAECSLVRVHFDFDAWSLKSEDRPPLMRVARCLRADQKLHITVEGNADERGTEEYNLQLGAKRASQVERYLEALGVSNAQLKTISYGFEKPLCAEHNEPCWAQNRRAGLKAQDGTH